MKKIVLIAGISIAVLLVAGFGYFSIIGNQSDSSETAAGETESATQSSEQGEAVSDDITGEKEDELTTEGSKGINDVDYELPIDKNSNQDSIIQVMHQMVHQKIQAEDKWGALPLVPSTVNQVYEVVSAGDYSDKVKLLDILDRWKAEDFSTAVDDHNYFWSYQNGTIGKAYDKLSLEEEQAYIQKAFSDEIANQMLGL